MVGIMHYSSFAFGFWRPGASCRSDGMVGFDDL